MNHCEDLWTAVSAGCLCSGPGPRRRYTCSTGPATLEGAVAYYLQRMLRGKRLKEAANAIIEEHAGLADLLQLAIDEEPAPGCTQLDHKVLVELLDTLEKAFEDDAAAERARRREAAYRSHPNLFENG